MNPPCVLPGVLPDLISLMRPLCEFREGCLPSHSPFRFTVFPCGTEKEPDRRYITFAAVIQILYRNTIL